MNLIIREILNKMYHKIEDKKIFIITIQIRIVIKIDIVLQSKEIITTEITQIKKIQAIM